MNDSPTEKPKSPRWFWPALILIALLHFVIAMLAVRTKSVTYDEPIHTVGGWTVAMLGDNRVEPENPILFERFTGLLSRTDEFSIDVESDLWQSILRDPRQTYATIGFNYFKPPVDVDRMVNRRRPMFAMLGALTVFGVGMLTRDIARRVVKSERAISIGAICAASLLAFDPNMLGHSPLVKNDVILALVMTWIALATWRVIDRATIWNVLLLSLAISIAPLVKFSGILCGPIVVISLLIRAMMRDEWPTFSRELTMRRSKLLASVSISIFAGVFSFLMIWTSYGFRYHASTTNQPLNTQWLVDLNRISRFYRQWGVIPQEELLPVLDVDEGAAALIELHSLKILPESFTYGLLHVHALGQNRFTYLLGQKSHHPSVWYFPVAFGVKEPIGTLALAALLPVIVVLRRVDRASALRIFCITLPSIVFLATSIFGPLNIGLRHILPVYPMMFALIGLMIGLTWHTGVRFIFIGFIALSAIESLARAPNFIAFFNVAAGGPNAGAKYLSDSNIDWGQDLKLLRAWQEKNPNERLYLSYFGVADPGWYGVRSLPFFSRTGNLDPLPTEPGVIAISVYDLKGMSMNIHPAQLALFENHKPIQILGGSIYLYHWPLDGEVSP